MNIYFDESVHEAFGFMLISFVICSDDPQDDIAVILNDHGLTEFHSLDKMNGNEVARSLRLKLIEYTGKCRWGVFILPSEMRWALKDEVEKLFQELAHASKSDNTVHLFIDEGIIKPKELESIMDSAEKFDVRLCKSNDVNGIQLADLVAALNGVRLREEISGSPKSLEFGVESGFDPPITGTLGYELWAALRCSMHSSDEPLGDEIPHLATFSTRGFGLFVSDKCSDELKNAANDIWGQKYVGCIH